MDILEAHRVIQQRWLDKWPSLAPTVPFTFDNDVKPEADYYARIAIVSGTSNQYTIGQPGNRKIERTGYIEVRLTGPMNVGRTTLDALAKKAIAVYQTRRLGVRALEQGVTTHASTVGELRRDSLAGRAWVLTVTTPFEFYDVV